jgi:catechol 2,3-dioxygenase-like lactoylglutathione lyase family enzyme
MDRDVIQDRGLQPVFDNNAPGTGAVARLPTFERDVARPAYLAHVVLSTNNVERISDWYSNVLGAESTFAAKGLQVVDGMGESHRVDMDFVTFDQEHHRVAFSNIGGDPNDPPPARTLNHMAFTYADIGDLVSTYVRLKADGVLPIRTIHHGPTISNYYQDPDGNRVELQVDAFPNIQLLNDWFASGVFDKNPIGIEFDFDRMVERFDAGDDPSYLISNEGFIRDYVATKRDGAT